MDYPVGACRRQLSSAACRAQGFIQQCQGETAAGAGQERRQPGAVHTVCSGPAEVVRGGGPPNIQTAHLTGKSFSLGMCCVLVCVWCQTS